MTFCFKVAMPGMRASYTRGNTLPLPPHSCHYIMQHLPTKREDTDLGGVAESHAGAAYLQRPGEGQPGTDVQGKYKITPPSEALHRHAHCLISIGVIAISLIILSVNLTVIKQRPASDVHVYCACPPTWITFGNKCFYFSEDTGNWTFSRNFCKALEADLVQIDSEDELHFLKRYKGPYDHWIGLSRESPSHSWNWTKNTTGNFASSVPGSEECAYLSDSGVSSGGFYSRRKWICSKSISLVCACQITSNA